ncbi:MAG: T9SS type A sorting domain-containing protein [bacterium]|nr:T9SS type A sorting domain-containing protein [bacterium]
MQHLLRILLLLALMMSSAVSGIKADPQPIPDWRDVLYPPLELTEIESNPVLTKFDVDDHDSISFVADPFLFHEDGIWYMFFEIKPYTDGGMISVATSPDGLEWTYDRIVLWDVTHLSYPFVFKWDGMYYMLPDHYPQEFVRLYRATPEQFPYQWEKVADILTGRIFADSSIFRYDDLWWILTSNTSATHLYLYYSHDLTDPEAWVEHPMSPVRSSDPARIRCGGRPLVLANERIIRFTQDCSEVYGLQVRALEIDRLDTENYEEHELPESPILQPTGSGWNGTRMHQIDPWWIGDRWLCATDGKQHTSWAIGIYMTPVITGIPPTAVTGPFGLHGNPNPCNPNTTLLFDLPTGGRTDLRIFDIGGRRVINLYSGDLSAGRHSVNWNGCGESGDPLPSGLYLARLQAENNSDLCRIILLK